MAESVSVWYLYFYKLQKNITGLCALVHDGTQYDNCRLKKKRKSREYNYRKKIIAVTESALDVVRCIC
jgi:hypothetical protein